MEVSGAKTLLEFLGSRGLDIDTFATDRSSSIRFHNSLDINGLNKHGNTYSGR